MLNTNNNTNMTNNKKIIINIIIVINNNNDYNNKTDNKVVIINKLYQYEGAQWLSGRVLDSRLRGRELEPHRRHCVVILEQDTFILA